MSSAILVNWFGVAVTTTLSRSVVTSDANGIQRCASRVAELTP
ncbi:hypothetical protein [Streptomyces sp. MI02-7b]|nr:hypothetical protein [Streptomyces sp. MI02-7b]MDX3077612.1 hypothetical protein [Streptomyces sp. MI02-7b]